MKKTNLKCKYRNASTGRWKQISGSVAELADFLQVGYHTVYSHLRRGGGKIKATAFGEAQIIPLAA